MRVIRLYGHGSIENLKLEEEEIPKIKPNHVLIKIIACSLNRLDIWTRIGYPGVKIPFPIILGSDIAGIIEEVGENVEKFKKNDRVVLYPAITCNNCEYCVAGEHSLCDDLKILGHLIDGGYREYILAPVDIVYKINPDRTFEEAASIPVTGTTAWRIVFRKANPKPSDIAFVWGASSGTGIMLIELLKLIGCKVISTAGNEEKIEKAYKLGCDLVINYKIEDILSKVNDFTNYKGVDLVIDSVGSYTFETSLKICKKGGKVIFFGATSGDQVSFSIRPPYRKQISIIGSYLGSKSDFNEILKLFNGNKIKPIIDSIFKLEEAPLAHLRMEKGLHFGKILLKP